MKKQTNKQKTEPGFIDEFTIMISISLWAYAGVIIRFYLTMLGPYTSYNAFNVLLCEFIGSLIMGLWLEHKVRICFTFYI